MNLFSTKVRRSFSLKHYWELCDEFSVDSLQFQQNPTLEQVNRRFDQLSTAEETLGFVFDAEKLWLHDLIAKQSSGTYAKWLYMQLSELAFRQPMLWGLYSTEKGCYGEQFHDIWSGNLISTAQDIVPIHLVDDGSKGLQECEFYIELCVFGDRNKPNAAHLINGFKRLFNLPYHLVENQSRIWLDVSEIRYCSVSAIVADNPNLWLLEYENEYSSGDALEIVGRQSAKQEPEPDIVREAFLAGKLRDWLPSERGDMSFIPGRVVHDNKAIFSSSFVKNYLSSRATYSYLKVPQYKCTCGEFDCFYFRFKWGQINNFIQYEVGDDIDWEEQVFGYKEVKTVYVCSASDTQCRYCGKAQNDIFISVVDNRIVGLKPEIASTVKYPFQGPFISDDLITWDEYQKQWIDSAWNELQTETAIQEIQQCESVKWPAFHESAKNECIRYLYLISKYRHSLSQELLVRSFTHFSIGVFGETEQVQRDTQFKSCAVLHSVRNGEPFLIKFYWGCIHNFRDYLLGDDIQWSDYAVSDKTIEETVYARGFIDGAHQIPVVVHIDNNRIVGVHFYHDIVEKWNYHGVEAYVFYGDSCLPWLNMPDRDYLRSFRAGSSENDRPECSYANSLCCVPDYKPSESYLDQVTKQQSL